MDNGKGYRVVCKPLARGEPFTLMCGYIIKDEGRPWYQCGIHNIPREDLQQGRLQHISAHTAIDDSEVTLTQRNFFSEMFKFLMQALFPCIYLSVRVVAMYALQSAVYTFLRLTGFECFLRLIPMKRKHYGRLHGTRRSSQ